MVAGMQVKCNLSQTPWRYLQIVRSHRDSAGGGESMSWPAAQCHHDICQLSCNYPTLPRDSLWDLQTLCRQSCWYRDSKVTVLDLGTYFVYISILTVWHMQWLPMHGLDWSSPEYPWPLLPCLAPDGRCCVATGDILPRPHCIWRWRRSRDHTRQIFSTELRSGDGAWRLKKALRVAQLTVDFRSISATCQRT